MREVQALKLPACIDRVESEFQGDWNTLCIFVYLDVATSESDVDELKEVFSDRLERALESASTHIEMECRFLGRPRSFSEASSRANGSA